ncbi:hypothetical protein [Rufibacter sp. LB8]|uniref:hypothetical protein n=1 Tax=Rufibacter sp. LB8 TaxID=2777781 RepID=UPI00178C6484|nr:hypothetical protein [Rufibacter sp. LB8]
MKKVFFFLLLLGALCATEAQAQDANAKPVKVKFGKTVLHINPDAKIFMTLEERPVEIEQMALDQIDQAWILAAEALKPADAQEEFGDKATYGIVLLTIDKKYEADALKIIQDVKRRKM